MYKITIETDGTPAAIFHAATELSKHVDLIHSKTVGNTVVAYSHEPPAPELGYTVAEED